ncbi:Bacitracin export ATP-binding protein BceA [Corynebacterium kalinowskii]|uniref:Bacitracin export ATP-binding protein BceA n=1 Tax=Corynebacterium kalinowskii TaxID=2675216 RepID=A0A6B8VZU6_9CORY|nr:ABC transporter ATP-binding protein [Corynebacterium kalinowskii]QGU01068.1 Bacitracin export ATP-binding protein BceA [Corynebacterium kalinowskii]
MKLENITHSYPDGSQVRTVLRDVTLEVAPGELVAVMGPSGAGKTTLLRIAGLLEEPTRGRVLIDGKDCATLDSNQRADLRRDHLGFVFQDYNLIDTLTIAENVALPLELAKIPDARTAALQELENLGLSAVADSFPADVSGGEKQRAAIARAFIGPRSVILADEPTGALDTANSDAVMRLIRSRVDEGASGLLVTHEPRLAAYADRSVRLKDGELQ